MKTKKKKKKENNNVLNLRENDILQLNDSKYGA